MMLACGEFVWSVVVGEGIRGGSGKKEVARARQRRVWKRRLK
jgi:hypothetical protein